MAGLEYFISFLIALTAGTFSAVTGSFLTAFLSPFTAPISQSLQGIVTQILNLFGTGVNLGS